jgi:acetoin utilization deacetylase AcuC-like enzyme
MPLFPGTGARSERGEHDNIVNAPLAAGDDGAVFREAMETKLLPRIDAFRPDLIVISAGFDAHRLDPLGGLNLVEADAIRTRSMRHMLGWPRAPCTIAQRAPAWR